jgi:hypothetical protein
MFGILGFILIFILFVLLIGLVLIGNIFRFIFGWGKRSPKRYDGSQSGQSDYVHTSTASSASTPEKKKIFEDNEGEYVEFEEVE